MHMNGLLYVQSLPALIQVNPFRANVTSTMAAVSDLEKSITLYVLYNVLWELLYMITSSNYQSQACYE